MIKMQTSKGGTARHQPHRREVGTMTVSDTIALLTLLAVVIFGIIDLMKKK